MKKLSAIVPVGPNYQDFYSMTIWMEKALALNIQVIIVRDSFSSESIKEFEMAFEELSRKASLAILDVEGHSPGVARNLGMSIAEGEWITFWDCDDIPNPRSVMQEIMNTSEDIDVIVGQFSVNGIQQPTKNLADLALNPGNWRIVYRREFIGRTLFSDQLWGEDQLFIIETRMCEAKVCISKLNFYCYQVGFSTQLTNQNQNADALLPVIKRASELSLRNSIPKPALLINFIMILKMTFTFLKKSRGNNKFKSFSFGLQNSLQLFVHNKKIFLLAFVEIAKRVIANK